MIVEQCKVAFQVDNKNIWFCAKDGGHQGDHVSAIPTVTWSQNVISADDRLNALTTERDRYKAALERVRAGVLAWCGRPDAPNQTAALRALRSLADSVPLTEG